MAPARAGRQVEAALDGAIATWTGEHDGYAVLKPPATHRRTVRLDRTARSIEVVDEIQGGGTRAVRLAFHLGPEVSASLEGSLAKLTWAGLTGAGSARLELPSELDWSLYRGQVDPLMGWYSKGLGHRIPSYTLLGCTKRELKLPLTTCLTFNGPLCSGGSSIPGQVISWRSFGGRSGKASETKAEGR